MWARLHSFHKGGFYASGPRNRYTEVIPEWGRGKRSHHLCAGLRAKEPHMTCGRYLGALMTVTALSLACAGSSQPQNPLSPGGAIPAGWQTYSDSTYRFAVQYPAEYGVVPE